MLINLRRTIRIPFHPKPSLFIPLNLFSTSAPNPNANSTEPLLESQLKSLVLSHYKHGKFTNLLQNVVVLPTVILAACQNLTTPKQTKPFSIKMSKMATTNARVASEPTPTGTAFLETATATVQNFRPINSVHQHLCAFQFYSHAMTRQLEAHHFCAHQNEEMCQCLIYDSPEADAKLICLEYIISEPLFLPLPDSEKSLWHSHEYEVKSGVLFMPGLPGPIQRQDLDKLCKTYGNGLRPSLLDS